MDELLRIARKPAVTTHPGATVRQVCEQMMAEKVGAVVVVDGDRLVGMFSERDVVARVVVARLDPDVTPVSQVMTRDVTTASAGMTEDQAVSLMHHGHFRHLPLVDPAGRVVATLSVRHLLKHRVDALDMRNHDLVAYISADGPGG